ncbi:acyl-CoA thioesterase [Afifella sp. YEN Y35]|uniref:acyl-CoA thioesterase n=1 Tax=Afifella sp. YEN Y35 TaxID=3388337 RepID=UPI0039E0464D
MNAPETSPENALGRPANGFTRLIDFVFPGDANHHGTLFGGIGLAHMDKVAFLVASRYAHVDFVTASCERIDFHVPAHVGEIVELTGKVVRVGRRSLGVEVDLVAEAPLSGERRLSTRGIFNMVAADTLERYGGALPPLSDEPEMAVSESGSCEIVFPDQTSHYGSLYGGHVLAAMGKSAFVAATRHCRKIVVMAASQRVDFMDQVVAGEMIELNPSIVATGRSSMTVEVTMIAEALLSENRRLCGKGTFVMVAVDETHRPVAIA